MSTNGSASPRREITPLVIAFLDLGRFTVNSQRLNDEELADALDEFYCMIHETVRPTGGEVLKSMGDGALVIWPGDRADDALEAAYRLREATRAWASVHGLDCPLITRMHFGNVSLWDLRSGRPRAPRRYRQGCLRGGEARCTEHLSIRRDVPPLKPRIQAWAEKAHAASCLYPGRGPAAVA